MASDFQIIIVILLLCLVSFSFGWVVRDSKPLKIKIYKIKRRKHYRVVPYEFNVRV